jgi:hypothetical protein
VHAFAPPRRLLVAPIASQSTQSTQRTPISCSLRRFSLWTSTAPATRRPRRSARRRISCSTPR